MEVEKHEKRQIERAATMGPTPHTIADGGNKQGLLNTMAKFFKKDPTKAAPASKATKVILNENEQKHYYCPIKKRFVFEGE